MEFLDKEPPISDQYAKVLFTMSSVLPPHMRAFAQQEGIPVTETSRGYVFNGDMVAVIRFLDIGTRPSNLR